MSCYFRHLQSIFAEAGVRLNKNSRAYVHAMIQEITGEGDCPDVWRNVKLRISGQDGREDFISQLKRRWKED